MSDKEMTKRKRCVQPMGEIREEDHRVIIRLEMPGVSKEDLNIHVENDRLRIYAARRDEKPEGTFLVRERSCDDYEKVFTIDETIDRDSIDAVMKDGILEIQLQFKKEVQPRRIEIKGS